MRAELLNNSFEQNEETGRWEFSRRKFLAGASALAAITGMSATAFARNYELGPQNPQRYPEPNWIAHDPDRFNGLRLGTASIHRLHKGTRWAEGPAWNGVGRYVVYSDIPNNRQLRWLEENDHVSEWFRFPSENSNGNTFDFQGRQISCEHRTRRVVRYEYNGTKTVLADSYNGKSLNAPNDAVVHPDDGSIWFTDPGYGALWDYEGKRADQSLPTWPSPYQKEAVYRIDGSTGELKQVATDPHKPNGLAFSEDYSKLYVADTGVTHYGDAWSGIWSYDINGDSLSNPQQKFSMALDGNAGLADGIRVDEYGNVWSSAGWVGDGYDGVHVFAPNGDRIGQITLPEICANLVFAGTDRNRLIMCGSQSLYSYFVATHGAHLT